MTSITRASSTNQEVEKQALAWMNDPYAAFGLSNTRIHSIERREAEAIQLAALNLRLEQRRAQIPVLAKLADAQKVHAIDTLNDAACLLFEHNVYKSYPTSLLGKQRFDLLTEWLARLTPYDLSGLDVSCCTSIDDWLKIVQSETPLDVATSSGTSGTLSFFPKTKSDYQLSVRGFRVQSLQAFGADPSHDDLEAKIHVVIPGFRDGHSSIGRYPHYYREVFALGDDAFLHTANQHKISTDLMWLAGRLRAAAARGDASRVDAPKNLLARRGELEQMQRELPLQQAAFIQSVTETLAGQRVYATGLWSMFYEVAQRGLAAGKRGVFTPDSTLLTGGGAKGMDIPDDWDKVILAFLGMSSIKMSYGMTEMNTFNLSCEHNRYHLPPWLVLFVLDVDTGQPLSRSGVQTGRASYFDMTHDGTWGGIITGDKITVDWDSPCPCGRSTIHLDSKVERYSELQGGDDKITCAASPGAQAEAMDYLRAIEG